MKPENLYALAWPDKSSNQSRSHKPAMCGFFVPAYQAICTLPKYFFRHDLTVGLGSLKFTPAPPETTARPKGQRSLHNSESSRRDPGPAGTARVTNFTPHAGSGTCRAPTCEHATLCSHPMRRQTRQRAEVGKPGRRTARPKFGNTELSAQPTVASNGGMQTDFLDGLGNRAIREVMTGARSGAATSAALCGA